MKNFIFFTVNTSLFEERHFFSLLILFSAPSFIFQPLKDRHLFLLIGVLVLIDICILVCWHVFDPFKIEARNGKMEETHDAVYMSQNLMCTSAYLYYWLAGLCLEKGLLLIFGCFLAFETRKVFVPALNDSKSIGTCVYNAFLMSTVGATAAYIMQHRKDVAYGFITVSVLSISTVTLCLLFIPKIAEIMKETHPSNEAIRQIGSKSVTFAHSMKSVSNDRRCSIGEQSSIGPDNLNTV